MFPIIMRATPTTLNTVVGTSGSATISAEAATSASGGYFQINASVASGYIFGRTNSYSADL
jgi:hypothetical protein